MNRNLILSIAFAGSLFFQAEAQTKKQKPLTIEKQTSFAVGGTKIQRQGTFNNKAFKGWAEVDETGQTLHSDHAWVDYQKPTNAKQHAMIYIHGYGGSGTTWTSTPDGREGFATLMLRKGYPSYVMDLPGRGQAGKTSKEITISPQANEQFWFEIWRMGDYPSYNKGVQFPTDSEAFSQFFRTMTPDLSGGNFQNDVATIVTLANKAGKNILVTHSAGGVSGWLAAAANDQTKAVVAYEPGAFIFPENEMPEPINGLTGGSAGIPVPLEAFKKLAEKPIVLYFGDYIPEEVTDRLGNENWRVRLQMGRKFVEAINQHGGKATLVELPKLGIYGNTHFLMSERNNDVLADLLAKWLKKNKLD